MVSQVQESSLEAESTLQNFDIKQNLQKYDDFLERVNGGKELHEEVLHYIQKINKWDRFSSDDIMSEVNINLLVRRGSYDPTKDFKPWLYTVVLRTFIDFQRKEKRHRRAISLDENHNYCDKNNPRELKNLLGELVTGGRSQLETSICKEERECCLRALKILNESETHLLELIYITGLLYRNAADVLKIPVGTVKSRLHATILKFKDAYMESNPDYFSEEELKKASA